GRLLRVRELLRDSGGERVEGDVASEAHALVRKLPQHRLAARAAVDVLLRAVPVGALQFPRREPAYAHGRAAGPGASQIAHHGSSPSGRAMPGSASARAARAAARKSRNRLRTVGKLRPVACAISAWVSSSTK